MRQPVVLLWSGGKDSSLALRELLEDARYEVVGLLTSVAEQYGRISHHGVRETLLDDQAAAIDLPLHKVYLPATSGAACSNQQYEQLLSEALSPFLQQGVRHVACGDLFLEDIRAYRERHFTSLGMQGLFPLWGRDTRQLAQEFIAAGFQARLSCVVGRLGRSRVGAMFDEALLSDLPADVDPCGENGEFHTYVFDGPIFTHAVPVMVGEKVLRDGHYYADLLSPSEEQVPATPIPPLA